MKGCHVLENCVDARHFDLLKDFLGRGKSVFFPSSRDSEGSWIVLPRLEDRNVTLVDGVNDPNIPEMILMVRTPSLARATVVDLLKGLIS